MIKKKKMIKGERCFELFVFFIDEKKVYVNLLQIKTNLLVDSFVLRNPPEHKDANRYAQYKNGDYAQRTVTFTMDYSSLFHENN